MQADMGFFEQLQSLDERTKTKVLIVATAIAMIVVIYVWLAYFNNLIAGVAQPAPMADASGAATEGAGVWQSMQNAAGFLYGKCIGVLHALGNILQAPRQYIIQPPR
jgi:hypothetical protein